MNFESEYSKLFKKIAKIGITHNDKNLYFLINNIKKLILRKVNEKILYFNGHYIKANFLV